MTSALTATSWMAVHLHYCEPWEQFLVQAIKPYAATVIATGIAQQYNFLRFWERGPHIRLRFKGDAEVLKNLLQPNLEKHFHNYFEVRPSLLNVPNYPTNFPQQFRWLPNNSIQYAAFEIPVHRLGGEDFSQVAEQHFQASSDIVLHLMETHSTTWDSEEALLAAVKLHLSLLHSMGLNRSEMHQFVAQYFKNWLQNAPHFTPRSRRNPQFELSYRDQLLKEFKRDYRNHRFLLQPKICKFWHCLQQKCYFEDEAFNEWLDFNQAAYYVLRTKYDGCYSYTKTPVAFTNFCSELMHQTNNRLGIHDVNEGYLMYLLMHILGKHDELAYFG